MWTTSFFFFSFVVICPFVRAPQLLLNERHFIFEKNYSIAYILAQKDKVLLWLFRASKHAAEELSVHENLMSDVSLRCRNN